MILCLFFSNYTQRIISAKDHASVQINVAEVCTRLVLCYVGCHMSRMTLNLG